MLLCEDDEESYLAYVMAKGEEAQDGHWILDNGDSYGIPRFGRHSEPAANTFGQRPDMSEKSDKEMQRQYGHLFVGWPRKFNYNDVAMMNGWIRIILQPKRQSVAIEMMKGKATPAAKRTVLQMIQALQDRDVEYVFEFNTGQDRPENNIVTHDTRQAVRLVNS